MSPFNPERHYRLSPEEEARHRETEKRRMIIEENIGEDARRKLGEYVERKLTSQAQEEAFQKAKER